MPRPRPQTGVKGGGSVGLGAGMGSQVGPGEPESRDPSQGGKGVVRGRPCMSEAPSPPCLLCCPITLYLRNKFKGTIRNGKIILKIIFFDNFKIILKMIKGKSNKTVPTEH